MIQDIYPRVLNNHYDPTIVAKPDDYVISFRGTELLYRAGEADTLEFPKVAECGNAKLTYLFSIDEERYFIPETPLSGAVTYTYTEIREVRKAKLGPRYRVMAAYTGKHLSEWYRDTQFCGRCGQKMVHSQTERAMTCSCGYTAYPRIMPAVIVGVINGDKILLTKYRNKFAYNALVAGFVEIGETAEETVAREVMEETGVRVKNIRYYKTQPWGAANDLLLGYYCDVDGDTHIKMDTDELKYADWVSREDIELQPDDFSLTNEMMWRFKEGKENC